MFLRVDQLNLVGFGESGTMADPQLTLFHTNPANGQNAELFTQESWSERFDDATTTQVASQVFAFPLTAGGKDAAFVITVPRVATQSSGYSAIPGGTSMVLVEVYVVP